MYTLFERRYKSHHDITRELFKLSLGKETLVEYLNNNEVKQTNNTRCIYIHVPFCNNICSFCNMRRTKGSPGAQYSKLIIKQIEEYSKFPYIKNGCYDSIYFGGGTPTTLNGKELQEIIVALKNHLNIMPSAEISTESTLTNLDNAKLHDLMEIGFNRLSIGIQSFTDKGRQILGRRGNGEYAFNRINEIYKTGMDNLNIDLIYNFPDQSEEDLLVDLEAVVKSDIAGLSIYSLMLNENSVLTKKLNLSNDEYTKLHNKSEYEKWLKIYNKLSKNSFSLLELSKMVRDNRDSYKYIRIRNCSSDTLPLGAGAGGRIGNLLLFHVGTSIQEFEEMLNMPMNNKYVGLLVSDAYNFIYNQAFKLQFGYLDFEENIYPFYTSIYKEVIDYVINHHLGAMVGNTLKLNENGIYWGYNIASMLTEKFVNNFIH